MKPKTITNRDGYRMVYASESNLVFFLSPEGEPIYWTGTGNQTPAEGMAIAWAAAVEAVDRVRRDGA
jgi:hypothetical protein